MVDVVVAAAAAAAKGVDGDDEAAWERIVAMRRRGDNSSPRVGFIFFSVLSEFFQCAHTKLGIIQDG